MACWVSGKGTPMPNHPSDEAWVEYLYGELELAERRRLATHLTQCEDCLAKVETWRSTTDALNAWRVEAPARSRRPGVAVWAAGAAAALLLMVLGYGAARITAPEPVDVPALKAEVAGSVVESLEPRLRADLMAELRGEWVPALGATRDLLYETLYEQMGRDVREVAARAMIASTGETNRLLGEYLQGVQEAHEEDREAVIHLVELAEEHRRDDAARMRQGLGTLAALTGEEFGRTHAKIDQLVGYRPGTSVSPGRDTVGD